MMVKGLPYSGKTKWAERWVAERPSKRIRLSWTDILRSIGRPTRANRLVAFEGVVHMMLEALRQGVSVVVDECNLDGLEWGLFATRAQQMRVWVAWHSTGCDTEACIKNASQSGLRGEELERVKMDVERKAEVFGRWLKQ